MRITITRLFQCLLLSAVFIGGTSCSSSTDSDNSNSGEDSFSHTKNPGHSAISFLTNNNYGNLVIEVDYMEGYAPNPTALDSLKDFLSRRLQKTSVTILEPTSIPASGQASYTSDEIRALEKKHRNKFTDGTKLAAYILITDNRFEQENVLGIAYYNTSTAFFGGTYDEVSGGLGQPSRKLTESISFRHEFGHLLGLVNIPGSDVEMQTNHQDTEHGSHCTNENCLMYYAIENANLFDQFFGSSIPKLDANCIADLQAVKK